MSKITLYLDKKKIQEKANEYSLYSEQILSKCQNKIEIDINDYLKLKSFEENSQKYIDFLLTLLNKHCKKFKFSISDDDDETTIKMHKHKICKANCKICPSTLKLLKEQVNFVSKDGKHNEFGGVLEFIKGKKKSYYFIKIDKKEEIISGDNDETDVPDGIAGYHTHPAKEYEAQKVKYAWPSGDDYIAVLDRMINDGTIIHIVASVEGLYIISFSDKGIMAYEDSFFKNDKNDKKKFEYSRKYKLKLPSISDKDSMSPTEYIHMVNNIDDKYRVFNVQFITWKQADTQWFELKYPFENTCNLK
jgi:hypothetical protein